LLVHGLAQRRAAGLPVTAGWIHGVGLCLQNTRESVAFFKNMKLIVSEEA